MNYKQFEFVVLKYLLHVNIHAELLLLQMEMHESYISTIIYKYVFLYYSMHMKIKGIVLKRKDHSSYSFYGLINSGYTFH